jgi:hypothetical protein
VTGDLHVGGELSGPTMDALRLRISQIEARQDAIEARRSHVDAEIAALRLNASALQSRLDAINADFVVARDFAFAAEDGANCAARALTAFSLA